MEEQEWLNKLQFAQDRADKWFSKYENQKQHNNKLLFENGQMQSYIQELEYEKKQLIARVVNLEHNTKSIKIENREERLKIHREEAYRQKLNEIQNLKNDLKLCRDGRNQLILKLNKLETNELNKAQT